MAYLSDWKAKDVMSDQECYFCNKIHGGTSLFQGYSICWSCHEKLMERIKLILNFE